MKYQKSMMKILENTLMNRERGKTIAETIREAHSGRSSSFEALEWLEKNGFVTMQSVGNQKIILPVVDNYTLQYKYYLDSLKIKTFSPFTKLLVMILAYELSKIKGIKNAILFGSALSTDNFKEIHISLSGESVNEFEIKVIQDKIFSLFNVELKINYASSAIEDLFKGVVIYQSSYTNLLSKSQTKYLEFLDSAYSAIKNQSHSNELYKDSFEKSVSHLAICYALLSELLNISSNESEQEFNKKYSIKHIKDLLKAGIEVGGKIFK